MSALDAHQRGGGVSCAICGAPALPLDGICVFCHAPLDKEDQPIELLDYLVERIPIAKVKRGHLNRGPITEVVFELGGRTLRARWNKEGWSSIHRCCSPRGSTSCCPGSATPPAAMPTCAGRSCAPAGPCARAAWPVGLASPGRLTHVQIHADNAWSRYFENHISGKRIRRAARRADKGKPAGFLL